MQISNRGSVNNLAASLNLVKLRSSRDGSIAEVNEDLYKDSVESCHDFNGDLNSINNQQIILQFEVPKKVKNYYS